MGTSPGTRLTLSLYTLPDCQPCKVVKTALDDQAFEEFHPIDIQSLSIDEVRALRKQVGETLAFPILAAKVGDALISRRIGAKSSNIHEERGDILAWIQLAQKKHNAS